jgi:ABC-2 type transport system permease protein
MTAVRAAVDVHPVSLARVLKSEWVKLRTLRSTVVVLAITVVGVVAIDLALSYFQKTNWATLGAHDHLPANVVNHSMFGVNLGQLAIGVLGVLVISGEYSTGMIRATLAAVPTRLPVLYAKAAVFGAVAFVVSLAASLCAFFATQAVLGSHGVSLGHPGASRAVVGIALYLTVVGLLGMALGFLTRNTAGGIAALVGILLVLPAIGQAFPASWQHSVLPYFPNNAGQALYTLGHGDNQTLLHPWAGFGLFAGYTVVVFATAAFSLRRRDA